MNPTIDPDNVDQACIQRYMDLRREAQLLVRVPG